MGNEAFIYKILGAAEWHAAQKEGIYRGSADDARDGFIHFSTAAQVNGTQARHFAGRDDLLLLEVDAAALGDKLVYEPSRGGALFPHLYDSLPLSAVKNATALPVIPA